MGSARIVFPLYRLSATFLVLTKSFEEQIFSMFFRITKMSAVNVITGASGSASLAADVASLNSNAGFDLYGGWFSRPNFAVRLPKHA